MRLTIVVVLFAVTCAVDFSQDDCQPNETFVQCGTCEGTCKLPVVEKCPKPCKPGRCECLSINGFVRAHDGACIKFSECDDYISPFMLDARELMTKTTKNTKKGTAGSAASQSVKSAPAKPPGTQVIPSSPGTMPGISPNTFKVGGNTADEPRPTYSTGLSYSVLPTQTSGYGPLPPSPTYTYRPRPRKPEMYSVGAPAPQPQAPAPSPVTQPSYMTASMSALYPSTGFRIYRHRRATAKNFLVHLL